MKVVADSEIVLDVRLLFLAPQDDDNDAQHGKNTGDNLNCLLCIHSWFVLLTRANLN